MEKLVKAGKEFVREVIDGDAEIVKAIWKLPGSSELSLGILVDDTYPAFDDERLASMKLRAAEFIGKMGKKGISATAHFHLMKDYWERVRHGDPVTIVEIRESMPLYDPAGFFIPIKKLIEMGKVPGTKESLKKLLASSPIRFHMIRSKHYVDIASLMFESVVDSAQALLMLKGVSPPVPKDVPRKLSEHFPEMDKKYIRDAKKVISFWKKIEHGEKKLSDLTAKEVEEITRISLLFVEEIERLMEKYE